MIQSYVYQKSIRARGLCHPGLLSRLNVVLKIDLIEIKPDIRVQKCIFFPSENTS